MPTKQNIFLPFNDKSDKHLTSPYGNRHKNKMQHFIVSIILIVMICSQKNLKFFSSKIIKVVYFLHLMIITATNQFLYYFCLVMAPHYNDLRSPIFDLQHICSCSYDLLQFASIKDTNSKSTTKSMKKHFLGVWLKRKKKLFACHIIKTLYPLGKKGGTRR